MSLKKSPTPGKYVGIRGAMDYFGVSEMTVSRWMKKRWISYMRPDKRILIDPLVAEAELKQRFEVKAKSEL